MLVTPYLNVIEAETSIVNALYPEGTLILHLGPGLIEVNHWTPTSVGFAIHDGFCSTGSSVFYRAFWSKNYSVCPFGVADSPEQFYRKYGAYLNALPVDLCVFFVHIEKDPENKGNGGGWRWRKWGPYVGEGTPQHEYLDDEDGFENGIYTYHIYETLLPQE